MYGRNDCQSRLDQIKEERQQVYGDPFINHQGIGMAWTGLLEPYADDIKDMKPIPPHIVALMMCMLKILRCRITYHEDNYDDLANYAEFAKEFQQREDD